MFLHTQVLLAHSWIFSTAIRKKVNTEIRLLLQDAKVQIHSKMHFVSIVQTKIQSDYFF